MAWATRLFSSAANEKRKIGRSFRGPTQSPRCTLDDLIIPVRGAGLARVRACVSSSGAAAHGFRSSFKDWATEQTNFAEEIAEACLAHFPNDKTVAAYQRGDRLEQRRRLMDRWGQFCCPSEAEVVVQLRA